MVPMRGHDLVDDSKENQDDDLAQEPFKIAWKKLSELSPEQRKLYRDTTTCPVCLKIAPKSVDDYLLLADSPEY
jgi:hypothetical protein